MGLPSAPPGLLSPEFDMLVSRFDAGRAGNVITYMHYVYARLFADPRQRENFMRGLIHNLTQRFGRAIVSDEVWQSVPGLRELT